MTIEENSQVGIKKKNARSAGCPTPPGVLTLKEKGQIYLLRGHSEQDTGSKARARRHESMAGHIFGVI